MLLKLSILNVKIDQSTADDLLQEVSSYLSKKSATKPLTICTPNPEQIVYANSHVWFCDLLNNFDIAIPDGAGIVWATKLVGSRQWAADSGQRVLGRSSQLQTANYKLPTLKRIPGVEFMEGLVKLAAKENHPVAFIGGRNGVVEKALDRLKKQYPGLSGWAEETPEFEIKREAGSGKWEETIFLYSLRFTLNPSLFECEKYFEQLALRIKETGIKLVFVGLGAPKQELFIKQLSEQLIVNSMQSEKTNMKKTTVNYKLFTANSLVFMSVGGAFDMLSGTIPRAPEWIQHKGLEWLWRLVHEPWRIGRQLRLFQFVWLVLKERFMVESKDSD